MPVEQVDALAAELGELLKARKETVAVAVRLHANHVLNRVSLVISVMAGALLRPKGVCV